MRFLIFTVVLWAPLGQAQTPESAQYYDGLGKFEQALPLWEEVLEKSPGNLRAMNRAADLRLLLKGRNSARTLLTEVLQSRPSVKTTNEIIFKLQQLHERFLLGDALSYFLQAQAKALRGDCEATLGLAARGLSLEPDNFKLLDLQAGCLKTRSDWGEWLKTLTKMDALVPGSRKAELAELHLFYGRPLSALETPDSSSRNQLVKGASLVELGRTEQAVALLSRVPSQGLGLQEKRARDFFLGKALMEAEEGDIALGRKLLRDFVSESFRTPTEWAWDPFRLKSRVAEARKLSRSSMDE